MTGFELAEAGWDGRNWRADDVVAAILAHQPPDKAWHVRRAHLQALADDIERMRRGNGVGRAPWLMAQIQARIALSLTPVWSRRLLSRLAQQAMAARLAGAALGAAVAG